MMGKTTRRIVAIASIHILACVAATIVFHSSVHEHNPVEAEGPDMPVWSWPLELVGVPLRVAFAITGSIIGGPIALSERPFADITVTYIGVVALLSAAWLVSTRRKGSRQRAKSSVPSQARRGSSADRQ